MYHFPEVNSEQCILESKIIDSTINFSSSINEYNKKIYIHHYNKDRNIVICFIDLLIEGFHIDSNNIFCKSSDEKGVYYDDYAKKIKSSIKNSDVIIFLITKNYINSKSYLVELGAAWAYDKDILPLILPLLDYSVLYGTPLQWIQGLILDDSKKIYDNLSEYFISNNFMDKLNAMQEAESLSKTNMFIDNVKNYIITQ